MPATKSALLCWIMASVILPACAGPSMVSRPVYQDPALVVRLESLSTVDQSATANTHPAEFTDDDLSKILRTVMVQKEVDFWHYYVLRQDPKPERAFLDDDIALLVPHLRAALAKARPEESAVFLLNRPRDQGISEVTSGAILIRGDRLHLFLANWRIPVTTARKLERVLERPLVPLGTLDFSIVSGPSQMALQRYDPSFPSWARRTTGVAITRRPTPDLPPLSSDLPMTEAPIDATIPSPSATPSPPLSLEMKLRQLKSWRDQALISEQEYQEQKRKALETF